MNLPGLSLLGYDSLVTQWGPLEQARRPKAIDQKIREAEKHIEALREAIKGGAGSLPDIREAYDSALKVVHGIGSTHPRWGRQIADQLYRAVSSGNDVRSLAEELRDMGIHEPRINPLPRKGGRGGGHSDEDRAAWKEHREKFFSGLPTEVQQHENPKKPKKLYDTPGGRTLIDDMEEPKESAESTSIANSLASGGRIEPRVIDVQPSKEPEKPAAKSEKPAQDAAAEEGQPQSRVRFKHPTSVDVADPPSHKGGNGGGGSVPPSEPSTAAGGGKGSERDRQVIAAYERLFSPTEDASKTYKARWADPTDITASEKVFHQPGKNPVNRYTQVLGDIYTRLMGKAQNTTLDEIRSGDPRGTHAKRMRTLRSIYSQIAEADRPKLDDVHRAFIYKVSPLLDKAGASEGSVMADSPVMKDIFHTVVSHTIGDAEYDPEYDYIAPLRTGRERRKEWEAGLQDPPKGPEQQPEPPARKGPASPGQLDFDAPPEEEPQAGDGAQQPAAEGENLREIEAPAPEAPEQQQQPQQPKFQPEPRQPARIIAEPGQKYGVMQPYPGTAEEGQEYGVMQPPPGKPARPAARRISELGPEPIGLPDPPMAAEPPEAAPEQEVQPPAEENEAQPRQSPFSGTARKPVSLPYRPWSKPAPEEEPPESPVEERWEGLKSGKRKFTAAQPMWKNLPRKPVSLPYSPWGKSGGPELPPDEEGSGSGRPRNPRPLLTDPSRYSWSEPKEGPKPYDATEDETSSDYRPSGGRVSGGEDESPWSRFYNKADKFFSRLSGDAKFERSPDSQPRRSSRWARSSRAAPVQLPASAPPPKPIQREGGWTPANRPDSDSNAFGAPIPAPKPQRFATTMALRNKAAQRAKPTMSPQGKPIPGWLDKRRIDLRPDRKQDLASMMEMMLQQMRTTRWKRDDTTRTGGVAPVNTPAAAPIPSQPNEQPSLLDLARSGPTSYQYGQAPNIEGDIRTARSLNKQTPPESAKLRYVDPIGDSTPAARTGASINAEDTGEGKRSTADTMNDQSVKRPKFKKVAKEASLL